jgi:hypothetical protein
VIAVVVLDVEGMSDWHAANAVLYFGLDVTEEFADGALPAVFFGKVTPCSVMQLRNAASCVDVAPAPPAPPPPNPEPAGRKLAHAWNAARDFELPPAPNPPAGAPPVDDPDGLLPLPKPEPVTPCCLRHVVNAVLDADEEDFAGVVVVVVLDVVGGADVAAPPPQAANTTPARAMASTTAGTLRCLPRRFTDSVQLVMGTVWKTNLDDR